MRVGQSVLKIEFEFYTKLKNDKKITKPIPKSISNSSDFKALIASKIVEPIRRKKGFIELLKKREFVKFYKDKFPHPTQEIKSQIDSQKMFKNTKASSVQKDRIVFLRGFNDVFINGKKEDLNTMTQKYNIFSVILKSLKAKKICFVENLEPFLMAEKLLGRDYIYIHFYGRFPKKEVLEKIECEEYLHFGDYDFVGLSEYLKADEVFKKCKIYIPENFDELFEKYSTIRKSKDVKYKNIKHSCKKEIEHIVRKIENGKILEQQIVMDKL